MRLKKKVWQILEIAQPNDKLSRAFDAFLLALISLNVLATIVGTVDRVQHRFGVYLDWFELVSVLVFSVEYLGRVWACTVESAYSRPFRGRVRFVFTPLAIIDLLAIVPFYLPFLGADFRFLRTFRLVRLLRMLKLARYMNSLRLMGRVFRSKKEELLAALGLLAVLLIITSSAMYYVEHSVQPETFSDIPTSMWWAVSTLTTVGYGDIYPVSPLGRLLGSIVAILGIGVFALPTAILGSGFLEEVQKRKRKRTCPHCGKHLD